MEQASMQILHFIYIQPSLNNRRIIIKGDQNPLLSYSSWLRCNLAIIPQSAFFCPLPKLLLANHTKGHQTPLPAVIFPSPASVLNGRTINLHNPTHTMPSPAPPAPEPPSSNSPPPAPPAPPPSLWFHERLTPHTTVHHGVRALIHSSQTPYQSLTIADIGAYGRALFLDGCIQTATGDEALYHEPIVHAPAALSARAPRAFLVLGGADGGAVREALRWRSAERVVLVDIDAQVIDACQQHLEAIHRGALRDKRVAVVPMDAAEYIRDCAERFDVVVCDLTDPLEDSPSLQLFTSEFFAQVKRLLRPGGVMSLQAGPASLAENATLFPRVCATLRGVFGHVRPFQIFPASYGAPLGMAVAAEMVLELLGEEEADERFGREVKGDMEVVDGAFLRGMFALPKRTRRALEMETRAYCQAETAAAFGQGSLASKRP